MLANKLKIENLIKTENLDEIVLRVACSTKEKWCMYNECVKCKDARYQVEPYDGNQQTTWKQWKTKSEERDIKKDGHTVAKFVTLTIQEETTGSIHNLLSEFEDQLARFKAHYLNIQNQFMCYQKLRKHMRSNEALIHIDFSENYIAKLASAVQSAHFGAS